MHSILSSIALVLKTCSEPQLFQLSPSDSGFALRLLFDTTIPVRSSLQTDYVLLQGDFMVLALFDSLVIWNWTQKEKKELDIVSA